MLKTTLRCVLSMVIKKRTGICVLSSCKSYVSPHIQSLFSLSWLTARGVKWGHRLCVCVAPPILMSTRSCPLCVEPGPEGKCSHSQGRVDKGLWAHGCNLQNKPSRCIYVGCSLNCFSQSTFASNLPPPLPKK